jgi:hypothetical protein
MSTPFVCQHCGAPWQSDVIGACRFCRVVAPPPGVPTRVAGARPTIDADALCRVFLTATSDPSRPLDRLAADLVAIAGDRAHATGSPSSRVELALDDWVYQAWLDRGDVAAVAVHTVRGIVLKHQPLAFDEWIACIAGHLAEYAATHPHIYDAIIALDHA